MYEWFCSHVNVFSAKFRLSYSTHVTLAILITRIFTSLLDNLHHKVAFYSQISILPTLLLKRNIDKYNGKAS